MKINVNQNDIKYILDNKDEKKIEVGYEEIHNHGFQVVDHIVDILLPQIKVSEDVEVFGENIESNMIARKLEDKIKREVKLSSYSGDIL